MTLILARELRGRDITVNVVAPGPTATALFLEGKDDETIQRLASQAPLERLGAPADIAEVVAFLAGPARWINGQVLRANGGIV
jgi:3-oxoacyl-[acyl-carrier protein] reductase